MINVVDQGLATLGLFDFASAFEQCVQIAVFVDQQGGGFNADTGGTGHVVHAVASKGLHIDHAFGIDAKFLVHTIAINALVLHRVKHFDAVTYQLHHVFVRANDGATAASFTGLNGKGGDDVICLETFDLFAGDVKRLGRRAGQRHLRAQVFWHRLAVGFVLVIHIVAESMAALVENNGDVCWGICTRVALNIAVQHVAKACNGTNRHPIGFAS